MPNLVSVSATITLDFDRTNTPLAQAIVKDLHPDLDTSKWPDGSEFAKVVAWFASDEAKEIDGEIIETGGLRP